MSYTRTIACLAACSLAVYAADTAPAPAPAPAAASAMELMAKVGPEHTALAKLAGDWDVQASMWMAPGAPPAVSKATATFTVMLGGKWVRQDYRGEMMGQPYIGVGMDGYDTVAKRYVASWYDTFSTAPTHMVGSSADGGKTITFTSRMDFCPMTGGPIEHRYVLAHESADRMQFTLFATPQGGTEAKSMELIYARKKAAK